MNAFVRLAAAGTLALSAAALAAPASADSLGSFAQIGTGTNIVWLNAELFSGGHNATTEASDHTSFSFNTPDLLNLVNLGALFNLSTTQDTLAATGHGVTQIQGGVSGSFSLTYDPTHTTAAENALVQAACPGCTNLLTVTFTNAWILGGGATAHFTGFDDPDDDPAHPTTVTFTSQFVQNIDDPVFDLTLNASRGFTIAHTGTTTPLNHFEGATTGNFAFTPGVPEPATWGLMIVGFGGAGAMLRRRRAATAFA
jgi:hypothetical protein